MKEKFYLIIARVNYFDIFAFFNAFLFLMMTIFVYYDRFIQYRGAANLHEFFFYALVIFFAIAFAWVKYRHIDVEFSILILIEITILIHFSGAFIQVDGHRLYDFRYHDIRYDKIVHFFNSMICSYVFLYLYKKNGYEITKIVLGTVLLNTLGIGTIIELLEFAVTLTVPHNGVGDYNNNMFDLLANFLGGATLVLTYLLYSRQRS